MVTATSSDSRSTKQRLLAAAIEVLAECGYDGARVTEVARRADVTTGAIYGIFGNKSNMMIEALATRTDRLLDPARLLDDGADMRAHLPRFIGWLVGPSRAEDRLVLDLLAGAPRDQRALQAVTSVLDAADGRIEAIIAEGQARGDIDARVPAGGLRFVVQLLVLGSFVTRALERPQPPAADVADVLDAMRAGLAPSVDVRWARPVTAVGGPPPGPHAVVPRRGGSTRDQLLAAASEVFLEKGFYGARVGEIARRAHLTTGAIYRNFAGKSDLLAQVIVSHGAASLLHLSLDASGQSSPRAGTTELVAVIAGAPMPEHRLVLDLFNASTRYPEAARIVRRTLGAADVFIVDVLEEMHSRGALGDHVKTEAARHVVQLLVLGSFVTRALNRPPSDRAALADTLTAAFAGLAGHREPSHS